MEITKVSETVNPTCRLFMGKIVVRRQRGTDLLGVEVMGVDRSSECRPTKYQKMIAPIAYLKPGTAEKYLKRFRPLNLMVEAKAVVLSDPHKNETVIDLTQTKPSMYQRPSRPMKYVNHTDGEFLARIDENPLEATNHLVFADWLDENGDPEEAEFRRHLGNMIQSGGIVQSEPVPLNRRRTNTAHLNVKMPWMVPHDNIPDAIRPTTEDRWAATGNIEDSFFHTGGKGYLPQDPTQWAFDYHQGKPAMRWQTYHNMEEGLRRAFKRNKATTPPEQLSREISPTRFDNPVSGGMVEQQPMSGETDYMARKKDPNVYPNVVLHAAAVLDNPLDDTSMMALADHLAEQHPDEPITQHFMNWVQGTPNWMDMRDTLKSQPHWGYSGPEEGAFHVHNGRGSDPSLPSFVKYPDRPYWHPSDNREDRGQPRVDRRRRASASQVANELYKAGGVGNLIGAVIARRVYHPEREGGPVETPASNPSSIRMSRYEARTDYDPDQPNKRDNPLNQYDAAHAPAGGVEIQGQVFEGGEFIPGEVMAQASPQERQAVSGEAQAQPAPTLNYESPEAFTASLGHALAQAGHDPNIAATITGNLTPTAFQNLANGGLRSARVLPSVAEVTAALYQADPDAQNLPQRAKSECMGFFDWETRELVVDGGDEVAGTVAHEISHALDIQGDSYLSATDEFRYIWSREMKFGTLSAYAATNEIEGFAEFGRLLYSVDGGKDLAAQQFPMALAFFRKHGLI